MAYPPSSGAPPLFRRGYAVFVRLWDLQQDSPAGDASFWISVLDEALLRIAKEPNNWFPSPYGGAVVVPKVQDAFRASKALLKSLSANGLEISIGITWGSFSRIHNVSTWNASALALNMAARLASNTNVKRTVVVDAKVKGDAMLASGTFAHIFGTAETATVKRTKVEYYRVKGCEQTQHLVPSLSKKKAKIKGADIVAFDIERYSEKPPEEQARLAEGLSQCVEAAISSVAIEAQDFGPAGDGGYLVFSADSDTASRAWTFAKELSEQARAKNIPLRIGIGNGPVCKSTHRAAIGGAVLKADAVSSAPPSGGIAVSADFWRSLAQAYQHGWHANTPSSDGSVLLLKEFANEELQRSVYATEQIVNRLYKHHEGVVKVVPFNRELRTIHPGGDLYAERFLHIRTNSEKIFYWDLYFGPEPIAKPAAFVSELDFTAEDVTGSGDEIVYLVSQNDPWKKKIVLFFLPAIDPSEDKPRQIKVSYRWPNYWQHLLAQKWENSGYNLRSPVDDFEIVYRIAPGVGTLGFKPSRKLTGAQTEKLEADAEGYTGWKYKMQNCPAGDLQFRLELL